MKIIVKAQIGNIWVQLAEKPLGTIRKADALRLAEEVRKDLTRQRPYKRVAAYLED